MTTIDNNYLLNKIVESLLATTVAHVVLKLNYYTFSVLLVSIFVTLVALDLVLGQMPKQKLVIETMDDPVARLYYNQNRLPETINMEGLYKRQYDLEVKKCQRPPNTSSSLVESCLNLVKLGAENQLFGAGDNDTEQDSSQNGGSDQLTFEQRYRSNKDDLSCQKTCSSGKAPSVTKLDSVGNQNWLFGKPNGNRHGFKAAPYCADSQYIACEANKQEVLNNHLETDCAEGNHPCLQCDLSEVPLDFAIPLKDSVISGNFYQECQKRQVKEVKTKFVENKPETVVQPHYVNSFPKYQTYRKNLAIKN